MFEQRNSGLVAFSDPARSEDDVTADRRRPDATGDVDAAGHRASPPRRATSLPPSVATRAPPSRSAAETRPRKANQSSSRHKPSACLDGPPASAPATSRRRPAKPKRGPSDQRPTGPSAVAVVLRAARRDRRRRVVRRGRGGGFCF